MLEIFSGIFGGFFAKKLARFLGKYSYLMIFFAGWLATNATVFSGILLGRNWSFAWQAMKNSYATWEGVLIPIGGGVLLVFIAFIYSSNSKEG